MDKCIKCEKHVVLNIVKVDNIHNYEYRCPECGGFNNYPKKSDSKNNNRKSKHLHIVNKIGIDYCEWCLMPKELLPSKQTLEAHHIVRYKDGGGSEQDNILILCTKCHKKVEHDRTYTGHIIEMIKMYKNNE